MFGGENKRTEFIKEKGGFERGYASGFEKTVTCAGKRTYIVISD